MTVSATSYADLRALVVNCTLKRSPERSHSQGLIDLSRTLMERQGVQVEVLRAVDLDIATGVWPDMTEHGWGSDAWPGVYEKVMAADILTLAGPVWLGDNSSVMKRSSNASTPAPACSTSTASTRTTAAWAAA
jgi:multimeric flavodoxin WrbA